MINAHRRRFLQITAGVAGGFFTPAEFGAYVKAETEKWGRVIRLAGVKPE